MLIEKGNEHPEERVPEFSTPPEQEAGELQRIVAVCDAAISDLTKFRHKVETGFTIPLGSRIRDKVTGLEGITTGRCEYPNGCVQYLIRPKIKDDGTVQDGHWIDDQQIEYIDAGITEEVTPARTGGPSDSPPPTTFRG